MGLPFEPEKEFLLTGRFDKALERIFNVEDINESDKPGMIRDHVFDCEDGLRLIVSKDLAEGKVYLHCSGSFKDKKFPVQEMIKKVSERFTELSQGKYQGLAQVAVTPGNVIHIVLPIAPDWHSKIIIPPTPNAN